MRTLTLPAVGSPALMVGRPKPGESSIGFQPVTVVPSVACNVRLSKINWPFFRVGEASSLCFFPKGKARTLRLHRLEAYATFLALT